MKVIFTKNVPRVGKIGEIKDQPDGYVRNFLLPKGFAVLATPDAVKKLERSQSEVRVGREVQTDLLKKNLRSIEGLQVVIDAKANDKGSLFKAIHPKDIVEALKKQHQVTIAEEFVHLAEPIKHKGSFTATVEALGIRGEIAIEVGAK